MPDVSDPADSAPTAHPHLPATAGLDGWEYRSAAEAALKADSPETHRVGWGFIALYTWAFISTSLLFLAPLLVTLALKVNSLVGIEQAPNSLALVAGIAAFWQCSVIRSSATSATAPLLGWVCGAHGR